MRMAKKDEPKISNTAKRKLLKEVAEKLPDGFDVPAGSRATAAAEVKKQSKRDGFPLSTAEARKLVDEARKNSK